MFVTSGPKRCSKRFDFDFLTQQPLFLLNVVPSFHFLGALILSRALHTSPMSARKTPSNSRTKDQATTKASNQRSIPRHSSSRSSRPISSITSSASSNSSQTGSKRGHCSSQSSDGSAPAPPTKRRRGESAGKRNQKIPRIIFDGSEGDDPTQQDDEDISSSSDQEDKEDDVLMGDGSQGAASDQGKSQLRYIAQQDK